MTIDYRLTLAGDIPVEQVAARAFPALEDRPVGTAPRLSAALVERYGFIVNVYAGRNGYVDADADDGHWEWEPDPFVAVSFTLDKSADRDAAVTHVATAVHRVLHSGPEDAAFDVNGSLLLLVRLAGRPVRHNWADWWSFHPDANHILFP